MPPGPSGIWSALDLANGLTEQQMMVRFQPHGGRQRRLVEPAAQHGCQAVGGTKEINVLRHGAAGGEGIRLPPGGRNEFHASVVSDIDEVERCTVDEVLLAGDASDIACH